jgi:multicomponent Na+:H+ antiporter subunit E
VLHALSLWLACFLLWLLLSGYLTDPLLLGFGVFSCALAVFIAWRAEVIDPEEYPLRLDINVQILFYWPWLLREIIQANIDVTKVILARDLPISPTLITLTPSQKTDLGRVIYANSITLTPGTVTTYLSGSTLHVHALTQEAADGVLAGEMDRRVSQLEGTH